MSSDEPAGLDLGRALSEGFRLVASRNGAIFVVAFYVAQLTTLLLVMAGGLLYLPLDRPTGVAGSQSGLPVGTELPPFGTVGAMVLASAFGVLVTLPLTIISIRTFVAGATDRIPDDCLFRRIGRATLSAFLASAVITVALTVPMMAALFGGVLVLVTSPEPLVLAGAVVLGLLVAAFWVVVWLHVLFVTHEIAVRDRGVVGALKGSWATVRRSRLRVFVLAVALIGLQTGVNWATMPSFEGALSLASFAVLLVSVGISSALGVVYNAVLARAYRHLVPDVGEPVDASLD